MSRSVLVVDDDPFIRRLVTTTLQDVADFELFEAADGDQALAYVQEIAPNLIFMDVDMPRLDGVEAVRRLRASDAGARATVVMLTAAGDDAVRQRAAEAGADLFLTKPFSPLELLRLAERAGDHR